MKRQSFTEVQNDFTEGAGYNTYAFYKVHNYGFVCINLEQDFVSHVSFNTEDDFIDIMGDVYIYSSLVSMKVGESLEDRFNGVTWVRLW